MIKKCKTCNKDFAVKHIRHIFCTIKCQKYFANHKLSIEESLFKRAKERSKQKNIKFTISVKDIDVPDKCPILNITLNRYKSQTRDNSYSLDRIDPNKGYVPGNIQVISYRANTLKNNGTLEEFKKLVNWMECNEHSTDHKEKN